MPPGRSRPRLPAPAAWAALLLLLLLLPPAARADELDDLIASVEAVVDAVAADATTSFQRRSSSVPQCECTHHACGGAFSASDKCHNEIGNARLCGECSGQRLDFNESFVLTPSSADVSDLSPVLKDAICMYRGMDETFASARDDFGVRAWTYVASTDGVMRTWPGHAHERGAEVDPDVADANLRDCRIYDPRFRPWYVMATSGPKDVVLVIDTSGSMNFQDNLVFGTDTRSRWDIVKAAILNLLDTFSINDYINMVEFNSEVKSLVADLVHATSNNVVLLKEEVERIKPSGGTDFRPALEVAFDHLIVATNRSRTGEEFVSSDCQKVILFMTDGKDCSLGDQACKFTPPDNVTAVDSLLDLIEAKQLELEALDSQRAHIFPISFGFEADDEIPKEMACSNEGVWTRVLPGDDPLHDLNAYTSYLASGRGDAGVMWTGTYEDEFGLGTVITAAKPIYSPKTAAGENGSLVGVVGHDVRLDDINEFAPEFLTEIRRFIQRSFSCIDSNFTGCGLQLLRGEAAQCPEVLDTADCYFFETTGDFYTVPQTDLVTFEEAEEFCRGQGGALAEIDEPSEEDLLAALATNAGSWIGLVRDDGFEWRWRGSNDTVDRDSVIWVLTEGVSLVNPRQRCAIIDRRGVRHNVHPVDCETRTHFICEFTEAQAPVFCTDGNVIKVDSDYVYTVPPLSTCRFEEERLQAATEVSPAAALLNNSQVVCDLGEEVTTFEARCCDNCTV